MIQREITYIFLLLHLAVCSIVAVSPIPLQYEQLDKCALLFHTDSSLFGDYCSSEYCPDHDTCNAEYERIVQIYQEEEMVVIQSPTHLNRNPAEWVKLSLKSADSLQSCSLVIYPRPIKDRTCLLSPPETYPSVPPTVLDLTGNSFSQILDAINSICHTFRTDSGSLSPAGLHKEYILNNLYSVHNQDDHVTFEDTLTKKAPVPQCGRISTDNWNSFYNNYLSSSKPIIITGAMDKWQAKNRWSNDALADRYGNKSVHVKLSPTSDYEGIESVTLWNKSNLRIPDKVLEKLPYADLVVPRPAPVNMKFAEFLALVEKIADGRISNASAYLEYSSIRQYFPELEADIGEPEFIRHRLKLRHLNMWLSDGNTVGKLHFDPYDNLLCQIDGQKEVILFEPHNNQNMYEAHIPEAEFSVNHTDLSFKRSKLLESTSMVMSPVDIKSPDVKRFPRIMKTAPLNCTISPGEMLFMPAFWWHEVQSYPDPKAARNLAVNFWYEPFLHKEYPCPACNLTVNPYYHHLL